MECGPRQFFQKCLVGVIVGGLLLLEQSVEAVLGIGKGRSLEARHWRLLLLQGLHGDICCYGWLYTISQCNWDGKVALGSTNGWDKGGRTINCHLGSLQGPNGILDTINALRHVGVFQKVPQAH